MQRLASLIPPLSASQLGLFRIILGTSLLIVFLQEDVLLRDALPRELHRNYSPLAGMAWVHWVAATKPAIATIAAVTYLALGAFIVGFKTRLAFAIVAVGFLIHTLVVLQSSGVHNLGILAVTLLCLLGVPWGDGLSLDARFSRSPRRAERAGEEYGFAIWMPGFTFGVALLAAAIAKLTFGGLRWVTEGAVKYHFVEDASNAPYTLGLWVASHEAAAIAMSFGAVALEGLFILNVLRPSPAWRAAFGLSGVILLVGFYVFHGLIWPGWWVLLLVFLPWQAWGRPASLFAWRRTAMLPWHYGAMVALVVCAQVYASMTRTEIEPLLTWFPMYAHTWRSTEAFDAAREERMSRFTFRAGGRDVTEWVEDEGAWDALIAAASAAGSEEAIELSETQVNSLRYLSSRYQETFGDPNPLVEVRRDREAFDWTSGTFVQVEQDELFAEVQLGKY